MKISIEFQAAGPQTAKLLDPQPGSNGLRGLQNPEHIIISYIQVSQL